MRILMVLFLGLPVLAKDSDRRIDPVSPFLPIVVKKPGGKPEALVGVLDSRCGRLVWEYSVRQNPDRISTLSAYGNAIQVGIEEINGSEGRTFGFDLKSGRMLFEHPGAVRVYFQWDRRRGIVLRHDQGLTCLDAETGRQIWSWKGKPTNSSLPTLGCRRLLVWLEDGGQAVVDGDTGAELWRRENASDETLLYGPFQLWILKGQELRELDLESGKESRRFQFRKPPKRAVTAGRFIYVLFDRSVQALHAETLLPAWSWDAPFDTSYIHAWPQGVVVETEGGRRKHLLDPESGVCGASFEVPESNGSGYQFSRNPLLVHYAYKTGEARRYTVLDPRQTGRRWQGEADGFVVGPSGPAGHAWHGDKIWCVDLERPEVAWNQRLPGEICEVMNHAGRLLVVAGPAVVALDPLRGDLLWRWDSSTAPGKIVLGYWPVP